MTGRLLPLLVPILLCGAALGAWFRLNRRALRRRRRSAVLAGVGGGPVGGPFVGWWPWPRSRPGWLVPELVLVPGGLLAGWLLHSPVPVPFGVVLVVPVRRWRRSRRAGRLEQDRSAAVVELCAALAGELRSGATPEQALEAVLGAGGELPRRLGSEAAARLTAARYGADVPAALRWLATRPGGEGANAIAACWQVTTDSGTGLALALDQVAEALRADRALREEIRGELTGPRTTAVLLAALPAFGLVLGSALGASPVRILLHTSVGAVCLVGGALLETAGLIWTGRIIRQAMADLGIRAGSAARVADGRSQGRQLTADQTMVRARSRPPRRLRAARGWAPKRGAALGTPS
ncbi:type II secretion system F family protein [Kitasatospora viridis]|uniref:Tight adherence protein B n=1 Tax=Kitasatospora viridis TaxID=281105 RepID=A0A561UIH9_9ACTN|nr:type II secretion system F family protein [Kitasatospora viridis]TWF99150.1 tight adherence protein B [Kitasatospora viridis]